MPNMNSLHRRLDRIDGSYDELHGLVESLERAGREHEARQAAWTAAGHLGAPPHRPIPPMSPEAPHRDKALWRRVAEGRARVIHGKASDGSPFVSLSSIYTLSDDALLAAINGHPLYAGWTDYDKEPAKGMPA